MRLLTLLALFLLPLSALAQSVPPPLPFSSNESLTVIHPAPHVDFLYDQSGNSATVYRHGPGVQWYSQENPQGQITQQGYLFDPMPREKPLAVPPAMRNYTQPQLSK